MADKKISQLTALTGANTASDDAFAIVDTSATETKKITLTELQSAPISGGTANGVAYLNGSKVLTTGSALTFDGSGLFGVGTSATPSHGVKGIVTANSGNASALQLTNNVGGASGGSLLYASSGDDFQIYTFTGAIGSESYSLRYQITSGGAAHIWKNGASESMRLTSTGLGIGTSSPSYQLDLYKATSNYIRVTGGAIQTLFGVTASGSAGYVGTITNYPLVFNTNDTERMRIDSSGNLLVGITSGATGLINAGPVTGKTGIFGSASSDNSPGIQGAHTSNSATGYVAYFANSGSGTGLYISNTAAWQSTSDERLKTDIKDLDSTSRLLQLKPRDYLWKSQETSDNPNKRSFGFIAQEVKQVFPELVGVSPDGMLSVEYTGLIAPLIKIVQEQQQLINQLTARVTQLEGN